MIVIGVMLEKTNDFFKLFKYIKGTIENKRNHIFYDFSCFFVII